MKTASPARAGCHPCRKGRRPWRVYGGLVLALLLHGLLLLLPARPRSIPLAVPPGHYLVLPAPAIMPARAAPVPPVRQTPPARGVQDTPRYRAELPVQHAIRTVGPAVPVKKASTASVPTPHAAAVEAAAVAQARQVLASAADDQAAYRQQVAAQIMRYRPRRATEPGECVLHFSIAADGSLASVRVAQSSGQSALDQLAMRTVGRAAPFPQPPADMAQAVFSIPFRFGEPE